MHKDVKDPSAAGAAAETAAMHYLQRYGIRIIERNYRCKIGEIDLVAFDGATLVFIEVRQRNHRGFGSGFESVNYHKQKKLVRTARLYLQDRKFFDSHPCRFDIVSISSTHEMNWIKDAFQSL